MKKRFQFEIYVLFFVPIFSDVNGGYSTNQARKKPFPFIYDEQERLLLFIIDY